MLSSQYFDDFAVSKIPVDPGFGQIYREWLANSFQGQMSYLEESSRFASDFGRSWAKYAVVCAKKLPIYEEGYPLPPDVLTDDKLIGSVSLYALGNDYHVVLPKLALSFISEHGITGQTEITVDTAAVNERAIALSAGLALRGRHAGLINDKLGTHFAIAVIFCEDLPAPLAQMAKGLAPSQTENPCNNCRRCQTACPVGAITDQGLDSRRCLSYWSIEHRGKFPTDLQDDCKMPIFGCDLCLRVCPHSQLGNPAIAGQPDRVEAAYNYICQNSNKFLEKNLRGTAYSRARGNGLKRNCKKN